MKGSDDFKYALYVIKNLAIVAVMALLIIKTGHWWPLFMILALSSWKSSDKRED